MKLLFSLALAIGAALLFALEPMVGKFLLPPLGSTPAVWNTTVLFFQAVLLLGYLYSHLTRRLRFQKSLHIAVMAIGLVSLPIAVAADVTPSSHPVPWLLGLLAITAGLPFFALAANGPMLQSWYGSRDPYFLFAASNAGSFLGLLAYPLLVEPHLSLHHQGRVWAVGYVIAALLVVACAVAARRQPVAAAPTEPAAPIEWRRRLMWLALAFVPSSLMLGVTTYATRDLTPFPLLWVLPLAIYLLTFVAAFAPGAQPAKLVRAGRIVLPGVAIVVVYTLAIGSERPLWLLLPLHLIGLAVAALMCHGRLAEDRPETAHLTEFYVWVALGGVLGGVFNAILAPIVFPGLVEYPLALIAALALRPKPPTNRPALLEFFFRDPRPTQAMDYVVPVLLGSAVTIGLSLVDDFNGRSVVIGLACGLALNFSKRPIRLALGLGAILLAVALAAGAPLERSRSFFGIYKVERDGDEHLLYDGTTVHGLQRVGSREPLEYYGRAGPAGQVFAALHPRSTGAIGLGAGALACYGGVTFFEIDPEVVRIARDPSLFTYLRDCPSKVEVGDGRRLVKDTRDRFDLLVVDAFNSDAVPVHLLTRQALALYLSRAPVVLFHISNRYLRLEAVLGNLARDAGVPCQVQTHHPTPAQSDAGLATSKWALLGHVSTDSRWHPCATTGDRVWTDDYSDLLTAIAWD